MHTRRCVRIALRRIKEGKKNKNKANKAVSKAIREKAEEALTEYKIAQMGCLG